MPVDTVHPTYINAMKRVEYTRDAIAGSDAVKAKTVKYLPAFIPHDSARYSQYLQRAYYTNFTGRTEAGLVGAAFRKPFSEKELTAEIKYMDDNTDGEGIGLQQMAKFAVRELTAAGNHGLLADYPEGPNNPSKEQVQSLGLRASIKAYEAETIINFDTRVVLGQTLLSLVVLKEIIHTPIDKYSWTDKITYRVLSLDDANIYTQEVIDQDGTTITEPFTPRQNGVVMNRIPFYFLGTVDNTPGYDKPALYDMADINYAHYRNTADREESLYFTSQKMIHVDIGDTTPEQWAKENPNGIVLGSRRAIVTVKGDAKILESEPTSELGEAIKEKEQQAVAIGAKLVVGAGINETAEAARINASSETAVLADIVNNVSDGLEGALKDCALFNGATNTDDIKIKLNSSFYDDTLTLQDIQALVLLKDSSLITSDLALNRLRARGWIDSELTNQDIIDQTGDEPAGLID